MATIKNAIALIEDIGAIVVSLLAAKYALGVATATDNIDILIKRRSKSSRTTEISTFDLTVPIALNFMDSVFGSTMTEAMKHRSAGRRKVQKQSLQESRGVARRTWCGTNNFELDDDTKDWNQFFENDLLALPDTRWTAKVRVPIHCLGLQKGEEVVGAWVELPLLPPPMSLWQLVTGGLWHALLPWGKTRHAVIVTDLRLFYVRHRRPFLPLSILGTDLRVDIFRHDHDVIYGKMVRTRLPFINRLVHEKLFFERFLPGKVQMQTQFGALELVRGHGEALDVYDLIAGLSRNTAGFIGRKEIEAAGVSWDTCQHEVKKFMSKLKGNIWEITPQPDDVVEPKPDIALIDPEKEMVVFHLTFKDLGSTFTGTYTNTDVIITTARVFIWTREAYKKFDCMSLLFYCLFWRGCLNRFFPGRNLPNSLTFVALPMIQSFSTDLSVQPPSWLVPHQTPLKLPCFEALCAALTRCITKDPWAQGGSKSYGLCPKRSGASSQLQLMWRLKQSSYADEDAMLICTIRPHVLEELNEEDAEDIYNGLGFVTPNPEDATIIIKSHDEKVEALRKIMSVVQDSCNRLSERMDDMI